MNIYSSEGKAVIQNRVALVQSYLSLSLSHSLESTMLCMLSVVLTLVSVSSVQSDSCRACNCQFNNVEVLTGLVETMINSVLNRQLGKVVYCLIFVWC